MLGQVQASREEIVSHFLSTAEGRKKLAASMVQPLRATRDYKYRYNCGRCLMGWNEKDHVHDDVECLLHHVHET